MTPTEAQTIFGTAATDRPYQDISSSGKYGTHLQKEEVMQVLEGAAFDRLDTPKPIVQYEHPSKLVLSVNGAQYFPDRPQIRTGIEVRGEFPQGIESARIILRQINIGLNLMYRGLGTLDNPTPVVELSELL